jgi:hypothetical protein
MIATGGRKPGGILVQTLGALNDRALSLRRVRKTTESRLPLGHFTSLDRLGTIHFCAPPQSGEIEGQMRWCLKGKSPITRAIRDVLECAGGPPRR